VKHDLQLQVANAGRMQTSGLLAGTFIIHVDPDLGISDWVTVCNVADVLDNASIFGLK
jgi:hypothetical protein